MESYLMVYPATTSLQECTRCGAVVRNTWRHDNWHFEQDQEFVDEAYVRKSLGMT